MKNSMKFIKPLRTYKFLLLRLQLFLSIFCNVLPLFATKKLMTTAPIHKIIAVFWLRIILDRLLKNCSSSFNMKVRRSY